MQKTHQWKAPIALGKAIWHAKTQRELRPLLQVYATIYGYIPDALCAMYTALPTGFRKST
jgi:hypothetical protein